MRRASGSARERVAQTQRTLEVGKRTFAYHSLAAARHFGIDASRLPHTLRIVLENVLRHGGEAGLSALRDWLGGRVGAEVAFRPVRVMMDDTAGLPLLGDLAAMRDAVAEAGGDPACVDPAVPVDFIVDHSVIADHAGTSDALERNMALELERNAERYAFLRWAAQAFGKLRVVPPGRGICHQINLEHLARVVWTHEEGGETWAVPDSLIGIDSHTPMVNSLGVVGWGVSGMEGVSAALGETVPLVLPRVLGVRLTGAPATGVTATDVVLTLTQFLRRIGVVGDIVEYCGEGLDALTLQDRATIANMTPEAGATMSYFPIDAETVRYLRSTGRSAGHLALVEAYARAQGLWREPGSAVPSYSRVVDFDLGAVEPVVSGPKLPHHRVALKDVPRAFAQAYAPAARVRDARAADVPAICDGDVVIAAITSCTNTSNPALMIGAGLLARNALRRGLRSKPWVKTSLSPGSRVVAEYLAGSGLQASLDALGFNVAGFGCMTCVGFSGPLAEPVVSAIEDSGVAAVSVLSGNRNYEGRAHPLVAASFLASPALVVAYALKGSVLEDIAAEPLGRDPQGRPVYLREIWPDVREIGEVAAGAVSPEMFASAYAGVLEGEAGWNRIPAQRTARFAWNDSSTFIRRPALEAAQDARADDIVGARVLAVYGDMVTTEHISPMGVIPGQGPAADYLRSLGIADRDFVSYAARRLNDEVMIRGTFASPHLKNELVPGMPGGYARLPDGATVTVFEAARAHREADAPLIVFAGTSLGAGSSRDWSAKGPRLLGVRAIVAESFERIYRANLVAAGILPLQFPNGVGRASLALTGAETIDIEGVGAMTGPGAQVRCVVRRADGSIHGIGLTARLDSARELDYFRAGGLLPYLLRKRLTNEG